VSVYSTGVLGAVSQNVRRLVVTTARTSEFRVLIIVFRKLHRYITGGSQLLRRGGDDLRNCLVSF